jgi:predicted acylesterase/phospholipase RssA
MAAAPRGSTRLKEIEALVEGRLCEKFDLIYGTSTGAIIAALLGLGKSVDDIEQLYRLRVVSVMGEVLPSKKTAALEALGKEVFGELRFDAFRTDIGIVGTVAGRPPDHLQDQFRPSIHGREDV